MTTGLLVLHYLLL